MKKILTLMTVALLVFSVFSFILFEVPVRVDSTSLTSSAPMNELSWTQGDPFPEVSGHIIFPTLPPSAPPPQTAQAHWYAGSTYPSSSGGNARTIYMSIRVPPSAPEPDEFYYVLLSAYDSAGSYDQIGFSNDYGVWGLTYSWTTGPLSKPNFNFNPRAIALSPGATYTFNITTQSGVTYFAAYQGSTRVWSLNAPTGGNYLIVSYTYSGYYSYQNYEEIWNTTTPEGSPDFDFYFYNNYWESTSGIGVGATWDAWNSRAPANVAVTINGNTVLVQNPGYFSSARGSARWPMFHHAMTHTGYSTSKAPNNNQISWSYTTGSWAESSPAVADGKVFIGSYDNRVYALDENNGSVIWYYPTGSNVSSSPAVADGMVFVGSCDGRVYALTENRGDVIWSYPTAGSVLCPPAVADGMVFVGSDDSKVYALNETTGGLIWYYPTGSMVRSSPAVAAWISGAVFTPSDGMVFVGSADSKVYALNETTGSLIWSYPTGSYVFSSPAVANMVVFVGSNDGRLYALNENNGSLIWSYPTGGPVLSSPAVADGKVFVGSFDKNIYALDGINGSLIWYYPTGSEVLSSPAVADGKVFVGSNDGRLYALNENNGSLIWSYTTGFYVRSSPAVAHDRVYVGSWDGNVYAFGIPSGYAYTDKPQYFVGETVTLGFNNTCSTTITLANTAPWVILNSLGNLVYSSPAFQVEDNVLSGGRRTWQWDQIGNSGLQVPPGNYTFQIQTSAGTFRATFSIVAAQQPDLVVSDIGWSPSSPVEGQPVTFTFSITNRGTAPAGFFVFGLSVGGTPAIPRGVVQSLASGQTYAVSVDRTAPQAGTYTVEMTVDIENTVQESDETNNRRVETFTVRSRPDLVVSSLTRFPITPAPEEGDTVRFSFEIKNQGGSDSGVFYYSIDVDGTQIARYSAQLSAGQIYGRDASWVAVAGLHTVRVIVDVGNTVQESDENNNQRTLSFTVFQAIVLLYSRQNNNATDNLGSIVFGSTSYSLPTDIGKAFGSYSINYTAASGYVFDFWEVSGTGISVANTLSRETTVTLSSSAYDRTLTAVYKTPSPASYSVHLESRQNSSATVNLGSIVFGGTSYPLPTDISKAAGSYSINYTAASGYVFDFWETSGGMSVANANSRETTVTVSGSGSSRTLRAVYKTLPPATYSVHLESRQNNSATVNLGQIFFNSSYYSLPTDISRAAGAYSISFSVSGYAFDRWETSGGVSIFDTSSRDTTATVSGSGTLKAIYKVSRPQGLKVGNYSGPVNGTFTARISVFNWSAPPVFAYQFRLYYDNTVLEAIAAKIPEGHWLTPTIKPSNFYPADSGTIDQAAGTVSFAATLFEPELGKTGSGDLVTVTFKVLQNQSCILGLENVMFVDPNATQILSSEYAIINGNFAPGELSTDLNHDGIVNILDITVVATAYGSHGPNIPNPGDPPSEKWNATADLDKNGTINILDISMVAKDYSNTA